MAQKLAPILRWLKHAFAVEQGPCIPTESQQLLIDRVSAAIVSRGLAAPAIIALETCRPLGYLGSQALHFFAPFLTAFGDNHAYHDFTTFLERPGAIEVLLHRIEELERQRTSEPPHSPGATPS